MRAVPKSGALEIPYVVDSSGAAGRGNSCNEVAEWNSKGMPRIAGILGLLYIFTT